MTECYQIRTRYSPVYGAVATVEDLKSGREMGQTSTFRDGAGWLELAEIQCRALNKAEKDKRQARNKARRVRDQVRRDCGLVRGRDSLGRVIWE